MPPQQSLNEETLLLSSSHGHDSDETNSTSHERSCRDDATVSENEMELAPLPRNVTLVLLYTWVAFTGRGLWNQNCLATLVFLLKNGDPKAIGFLTAAMGMAQLSASIPTGILADKHRRDVLLKVGAIIGIAAAGVSITAALQPSYGMLLLALVLWGIHWGIVNTSIMALFSDSIPDGERSFYFTRRAVVINFANTCGPAIALVMFAVMGDNWTVKDCSSVLLAGNIVSLPGLVLLCWMRDSDSDGDSDNDSESGDECSSSSDEPMTSNEIITMVGGDSTSTSASTSTVGCLLDRSYRTNHRVATTNDNDLEEPLLPHDAVRRRRRIPGRSSSLTTTTVASTAETHRDETYDEERLEQALLWCRCLCLVPTKRIIVPSLIAASDIVSGFASGMSIRYIAIFLYDNLDLSPVAVQVVYITTPILQVFLRNKAQILAGTYGRCKVTVVLKWIGISLMLAMVISYKMGVPRVWVCAILVLRTCFMNSPSSLTKSVLMDHVPKEDRGKWASLESVSMVSWSGSAMIGGILVESRGILFNFCFTAFLQFLATGPLVLLSFFDDRGGSSNDNDNDDDNDGNHDNSNDNEEEETTVTPNRLSDTSLDDDEE